MHTCARARTHTRMLQLPAICLGPFDHGRDTCLTTEAKPLTFPGHYSDATQLKTLSLESIAHMYPTGAKMLVSLVFPFPPYLLVCHL